MSCLEKTSDEVLCASGAVAFRAKIHGGVESIQVYRGDQRVDMNLLRAHFQDAEIVLEDEPRQPVRVLEPVAGDKIDVSSAARRPSETDTSLVVGGRAIAPANSKLFGTCGLVVTPHRRGPRYALTNYHVIGLDGSPVASVLRPGEGSPHERREIVGRFRRTAGGLDAFSDASLTRLDPNAALDCGAGALGLGPVREFGRARVGQKVAKSGAKTGVTFGTVTNTAIDIVVSGYPHGEQVFRRQIEVTAMSEPGDSGALLVSDDRATRRNGNSRLGLGLIFAGNEYYTYANALEHTSVLRGMQPYFAG